MQCIDVKDLHDRRRERAADFIKRLELGLRYVGLFYPKEFGAAPLKMYASGKHGAFYLKHGPGDYRHYRG